MTQQTPTQEETMIAFGRVAIETRGLPPDDPVELDMTHKEKD